MRCFFLSLVGFACVLVCCKGGLPTDTSYTSYSYLGPLYQASRMMWAGSASELVLLVSQPPLLHWFRGSCTGFAAPALVSRLHLCASGARVGRLYLIGLSQAVSGFECVWSVSGLCVVCVCMTRPVLV